MDEMVREIAEDALKKPVLVAVEKEKDHSKRIAKDLMKETVIE